MSRGGRSSRKISATIKSCISRFIRTVSRKPAAKLDFYIDAAHIAQLFPGGLTKEKFTYQLSDHLPLWLQINTDIDGEQLEQIVHG